MPCSPAMSLMARRLSNSIALAALLAAVGSSTAGAVDQRVTYRFKEHHVGVAGKDIRTINMTDPLSDAAKTDKFGKLTVELAQLSFVKIPAELHGTQGEGLMLDLDPFEISATVSGRATVTGAATKITAVFAVGWYSENYGFKDNPCAEKIEAEGTALPFSSTRTCKQPNYLGYSPGGNDFSIRTLVSVQAGPSDYLSITVDTVYALAAGVPDAIQIERTIPAGAFGGRLISGMSPKIGVLVNSRLGSFTDAKIRVQVATADASLEYTGPDVTNSLTILKQYGNLKQGPDERWFVFEPFNIPAGVRKLYIRAGLFDPAMNLLTQADLVTIDVSTPYLRLDMGCMGEGETFVPIPRTDATFLRLVRKGNGDFLLCPDCSPEITTGTRTTYDYSGPAAELVVEARDGKTGQLLGEYLLEPAMRTGQNSASNRIRLPHLKEPPEFVSLRAKLVTEAGQAFRSEAVVVPVEGIKIVKANPAPDNAVPRSDAAAFEVSFKYNVVTPGGSVRRIVQRMSQDSAGSDIKDLPDTKNGDGTYTDSFTADTGSGGSLSVGYVILLPNAQPTATEWAADALYYSRIVEISNFQAGANGIVKTASGRIENGQSAAATQVKSTKEPGGLEVASSFGADASGFKRLRAAGQAPRISGGTEAYGSEFLGIGSKWQFSPAIPSGGQLTGKLVLQYTDADLPPGRGFDPARMKIIAYDDVAHTYSFLPTDVDTVARTAAAQIDGLAPFYSLGIPGAAKDAMLSAALVESGSNSDTLLAVTNTGKEPAELAFVVRDGDGALVLKDKTPPAASTVAAGQQTSASASSLFGPVPSGWMLSRFMGTGAVGVAVVSTPGGFESAPMASGGAAVQVLPGIIATETYASEIHVANQAWWTASVQLVLRSADGKEAGAYTISLPAYGKLAQRVDALFPGLAAPFTGYLLVGSAAPLTCAQALRDSGSTAIIGGSPVTEAKTNKTTLYAAYAGAGPAIASRVTIANPTKLDASLTLRAFRSDGTEGGSKTVALPAGAQYEVATADIAAASATAFAGWLAVESTISGLAGHATHFEPVPVPTWRATEPLVEAPPTSLVIPYVVNTADIGATLAIANTGAASANVAVKALAPGGSVIGSGQVALPARGGAVLPLTSVVAQAAGQRGGYIAISSSQPTVAFEMLAPKQGDRAIVAAVRAPAGGTGGQGPKLGANPDKLDFGSLPGGSSKDLTTVISNTGDGPFTADSVGMTNAAFSTVGLQFPFTIAAGGQKTITVRFTAPASGTGTISGALAIGSITVALTGTVAPKPAPRIEVSPAALDFGQATVNGTKDLNLTISANGGGSTLTVKSIAIDNTSFRVVSPATPFSIAPGSSGGTATVVIRFAPTSAGQQSGRITIASDAVNAPSLAVPLSGSAVAPSTTEAILKVDGGAFTSKLGVPDGTPMVFFINRLTPPSYPATLHSVQIYFGDREDGLPQGFPITVLSGANPSGSSALSVDTADAIVLAPAEVQAVGSFNVYEVPPTTITQGDFVVGYAVMTHPGIYPAENDVTSASQRRSYVSFDGWTFELLEDLKAGGNLGIRAGVTLGARQRQAGGGSARDSRR